MIKSYRKGTQIRSPFLKNLFIVLPLCLFVGACSKPSTTAIVRVEAEGNTCWTGNIDGSRNGCGNAEFQIVDSDGRFSAGVRKLDNDGLELKLELIFDGEVVDSASGNIPSGIYGIYVRN